MIGPSPDWFVGVSGVSLLDGSDQWREEYRVDLYPYDAGTEDGTEFTLSNPATNPQGVTTSIDTADTIAVVGHNPGIAEFASYYAVFGNEEDIARIRLKYPTGALAVISFRYRQVGRSTGGARDS